MKKLLFFFIGLAIHFAAFSQAEIKQQGDTVKIVKRGGGIAYFDVAGYFRNLNPGSGSSNDSIVTWDPVSKLFKKISRTSLLTHTHPQFQVIDLNDSLTALQNRIQTKLSIVDAASTYTTISRQLDSLSAVQGRINAKLNITDAATTYITITRTIDSLAALQARIQTKQPLLGYTAENAANKATDFSTVNDVLYPTVAAVNAAINTAVGLYVPLTQKGANNGVAELDAGGKVPFSQLPTSLFIYKGTWNASTNSPALADGSGTAGWVYRVSTGGTQNLGSGSITFYAGDDVVYNGSTWEVSRSGNNVVSVNGQQGVVTLTTANISESGNLYYTDGRVQTYGDGRYPQLAGSYGNPAWITSLAWSKITGAPSFLTTETDPIYTASSWYSTTNNAANWNTAYGWGNHASAGYALSSRTITINGVTYDLSANRSWSVGTITGAGTAGYIPQWSSGSALGNSPISISGSWIFTNEYTLVSNHTSAGSAAKNLALVDGNTGSGNSTAIYMGYNANGGDPYGTRIVQTGYPGSTRRGGFKFQSHGDASGDTDAYYYDLLTLSSDGTGNFLSSVTATAYTAQATNANIYGLTINRSSTSYYGGISYRTASSEKWFSGLRESPADDNYRIYNATTGTDAISIGASTNVVTLNRSVVTSSYNLGGYRVTSSGTSSNGAAIGLQQETAEGWTLIYADYEPYVEWGIQADNPNNAIYITGGTSTNQLSNHTITNRSGSSRTSYVKIALYQDNGNITAGGTVTASSFSGAGTGLTGTASSLTAGAVSHLGGYVNNISLSIQSATVQSIIGQDANNNIYRYNASALQTFLGLNTSAYLGISLDSELGYYFPSSGAGAYGYLKTAAFRDANQDLLTSSNVTFNQVTATILGSVGTDYAAVGGVFSGTQRVIRLNIGGTYYYFTAYPSYSPPQP